jgi:predicted DNA-binding protein (MmcQ/YjbR family)
MQYEWLDAYLLAKPGAEKDYKPEWEWWRYLVGGKMFAAILHPSEKYDPMYAGKDLLTLKCDPLLADLLRNEHSEIMPGFYTDKRLWSSIDLSGSLDDDFLKHLCDESYKLVFEKLTRKLQREIAESAV